MTKSNRLARLPAEPGTLERLRASGQLVEATLPWAAGPGKAPAAGTARAASAALAALRAEER